MRMLREDFFSNIKIQKLTTQINKKTNAGFNYIYIKDKQLIKLLEDNSDWLDYAGICLIMRSDKKCLCVKWESR
jgi:hypothetical protein